MLPTACPKPQLPLTKFHAVKIVNEAVDQVRRTEPKGSQTARRHTRYIWLRNPANLSDPGSAPYWTACPLRYLKTGGAYQIRLAIQELNQQPTTKDGEAFLKPWNNCATHSRLPPIVEAAHTVKRHWDGILRWFDSRIANGLIEGINSLVQAAKAKARGYRSILQSQGNRLPAHRKT